MSDARINQIGHNIGATYTTYVIKIFISHRGQEFLLEFFQRLVKTFKSKVKNIEVFLKYPTPSFDYFVSDKVLVDTFDP